MHYPVIDFYRFFSSLIVCFGHILYVITNLEIFEFLSIVGVELFFVLSGFVLAPQLILLEKNPFKHLKVFLIRRWLRTLPAYFIALTCAAILFGYGTKLNLLQFFTYTQNFIIDKPFLNFYPVAWSLSVEEWFYIYIPILLVVFSLIKSNRKNNLILICFITIIVLITLRLLLNDEPNSWGQNFRRVVCFRLDALCFGVLAFIWKDTLNFSLLLFAFLLTIAFLFFLSLNTNLLVNNIIYQALFLPFCSIGFCSLLIILSKIEKLPTIIISIVKLGANISYSMYLFHIFFIGILTNFMFEISTLLSIYFISLITFCTIFYYFVELPFLKLKPNYNVKIKIN